MARIHKLIADLHDIRAAINAAREYNVLATLPRNATHRQDQLKAFMPN